MDAFRLANRAMSLQAFHAEESLAGLRRTLAQPADLAAPDGKPRCWYPFQLGFFLTVVDDPVDPRSDDRATVDLLWFPTGGGKIGRMAASRACHVGTPPGGRRWVPIGTGCDGHVPLECADYSGAV